MRLALVIFTVLASVGFFNYHNMLSDQMQKLLFYLSAMACFGVAAFGIDQPAKTQYPAKAYAVLMLGIAFSVVMASAFHMQSFSVSVMTTLPFIFSYGMLYALMRLDVDPHKIMNAYLIMCGVAALVYFANAATFPNNMFGKPILGLDTSRGIVRIPVVFIEFFPVVVFYAINQYLINKKKKWLLVVGVGFLMIFLSVIRQIIALTAVLGLLFYFQKVNWKAKAAMCVAVVCVVVFVLPQIPMYKTMLEFSEQQKDESEDEENIRITAWRYYTYENQTNALTAVFGNGLPSFGNSRWGIQFESEAEESGCFAADVGWAGFYWYFGIFATLALMAMMVKGMLHSKPEDMKFVNYSLAFLLVTSVASGPPVYYWQVLDIMMCLYFAFRCKSKIVASVDPGLVACANCDWIPRLPQISQKK